MLLSKKNSHLILLLKCIIIIIFFTQISFAQEGEVGSTWNFVTCGFDDARGIDAGDSLDEIEECNFDDFIVLANTLIDFLFQLALIIGTFILIAVGLKYIFSDTGNAKEQAKKSLKNLAIGIGVILIAWLVVNTVYIVFDVKDGYNLLEEGN